MGHIERKFGINANCLKDGDDLRALPLIKAAGFESVFTGKFHNDEVAALKKKADELGLVIEFIHAPFAGINTMWMSGMDYLSIFERMRETIDTAANNGIEGVVIHVSSGWNYPAVNDLGLNRFDQIVLYAKEKGVKVLFENLRAVGNLACLVDRYEKLDHVRFCYDCGHEHCYTKTVRWLDIFTTRLFCTHIHDNPGRDLDNKVDDFDWHMLPFDGSCDYARMIREMDHYGYRGRLTLEVTQKKKEYENWSDEEFLRTCYERLERISRMG